MFWADYFHIDGIRVDAVASMLYLDYGKRSGEWRPNKYGGHENIEAIELLKSLNSAVISAYPEIIMIAEESTAWPLVTKPPYVGGLGFHFKWNMGWMNDVLEYFSTDPFFRKHYHNNLTFPLTYAFSENYILPFSHDEVVHGKRSLIEKQPGDYNMKFSGLRAMLAYKIAHPGKKLTFMGNEFGQFIEWNYEKELDWQLLDFEAHRKLHEFTRELNRLYLKHSELWETEDSWDGFQWVSLDDCDSNIIAFRRINSKGSELYAVCNFAPVFRADYRIGVAKPGKYAVILNSDDVKFGGESKVETQIPEAEKIPCGAYIYSVILNIPPLSVLYFKSRPESHGRESGHSSVTE
jgi:1,4-alpha-glucan branching enzyme